MGRPPAVIIPVKNPMVLTIPEVHDLFQRAFNSGAMSFGWTEEVRLEVARMIGSPLSGIWIGEERNEFKALLMVLLPTSPLIPTPTVYMAYNEGSASLSAQMANTVVAFLKEHGYDRFRGLNMRLDDAVYSRLFKKAGPSKRIGSVMEFEIK